METARADKALAKQLPELAGWQLRDAFAAKDVRCNGRRIPPSAMVAAGDVLHVFVKEAGAPLQIVFEDEAYVVINKRQGMEVQGEGSVEATYARMKGQPAYACHRLDVQTGGLVLLAKDAGALAQAEAAFAAHRLEKTYQAVVLGQPRAAEATLHGWLRKDARAAKVSVFDTPRSGALPIETRYRVLARMEDTARLEIALITGRTHQIRAHLAHIGHPVLGDDKYGDRQANRRHGVRRQMLWATRLVLWDGRSFAVEAGF